MMKPLGDYIKLHTPFELFRVLGLYNVTYVIDFTGKATITLYGYSAELQSYFYKNEMLEEDVYVLL